MKVIFLKIIFESISAIIVDAGHTYDSIPLYHMHITVQHYVKVIFETLTTDI